MKTIYSIILSLLFSLSCFAQEGTKFEKLNIKAALAKAQTTGRKVFVACHTPGNASCKYMEKVIFPAKECGSYFNGNYICILKNTQEEEGKKLAEQFNVRICPTYLILNQDGSLFCRIDGGIVSKEEDKFMEKIKTAVKLADLHDQYKSGKWKQSQEENRHNPNLNSKENLEKLMNETMLSLGVQDISKPENWETIRNLDDVNSPLFRYLLENRHELSRTIGKNELTEKLTSIYDNAFRNPNKEMDYAKAVKALELLSKDGSKKAGVLKYGMLCRDIIKNKASGRIGEIADLLQNMKSKIPQAEDRMLILHELKGLDKLCNRQQKTDIGNSLSKLIPQHQGKDALFLKLLLKSFRR